MKLTPLVAILSAALLVPLAQAREHLTLDDVNRILGQGIQEARKRSPHSVIAIVDREGFTLACWDVDGGRPPAAGVTAGAIARAGAAAFLSSNQNAFSTRTAGWIIQQHFPPGVRNTGPGPLVGVGFSNLFFSDVNLIKKIPINFVGTDLVSPIVLPRCPRAGVLFTSLQDSPGGVPPL